MLWLGLSQDIHEETDDVPVALSKLKNHFTSKGLDFEALQNNGTFKDTLVEIWKLIKYEEDGKFRNSMMADERFSFCQWSGEWSIIPESVECIVAR